MYRRFARYLASTTLAAILSLLFLLSYPIDPLRGGSSHWKERINVVEGNGDGELLRIYSVFKSRRVDLEEASLWAISETLLKESKRHSIDPALVLAVISVESSFRRAVVSSKGARGFMQIRPFVANALAEKVNLRKWEGIKSLDDPVLNIKLGVFYLYHLKNSFRDLRLALTAYNWGPTEVQARIERNEALPIGYATKVLATYRHLQQGLL
ncbi:MAG: lytic transglycosylase domain-containing protein [Candidatus Binatia bacterium]